MGLKYLFEEVQVSRLCLLPKALAISLLFDCETCVVVDSGATSTSVWVVMDNKVDTTRTRTEVNLSHLLKDCFSNILVQGGNTDLQGFPARLSCDLREALPEHAAIINVRPYPTGNHSWNTAMGANMAKVPPKYDDVLRLHAPGSPLWMSREEYVLFGCHQLTDFGDVQEM